MGDSRSRHQSTESAKTTEESSRALILYSASSHRIPASDQDHQRSSSESVKDTNEDGPASTHEIQDLSRKSSEDEPTSNPRSNSRSSSSRKSEGKPNEEVVGSGLEDNKVKRKIIWTRKKVAPLWRIRDRERPKARERVERNLTLSRVT